MFIFRVAMQVCGQRITALFGSFEHRQTIDNQHLTLFLELAAFPMVHNMAS